MSQSEVAHFHQPKHHRKKKIDNDPNAADSARQRIAELPNLYADHAAPDKKVLAAAAKPVSPAAAEEVVESPLQVLTATAAAAKPKSLPTRLRPLLAGIFTFVLLFLLFKAPIFLKQINYWTADKNQPSAQTAAPAGVAVPAAPLISIPKINVNAPVLFANTNVEANIQKDLQNGVVHYANTALPGQNGNAVIFGHSSNDWWEPGSYKFVFVLLDKLQAGDTFTVNYNSQQYLYTVTGTKVVEPTDLSVLAQTTEPTITLITCTPPGTSWKRLIVTAKQTSPAPSDTTFKASNNPTAESLPGNAPSTFGNIWDDLKGLFGGN